MVEMVINMKLMILCLIIGGICGFSSEIDRKVSCDKYMSLVTPADEGEALRNLDGWPGDTEAEEMVKMGICRNWWDLARSVILLSHKEGKDVGMAARVQAGEVKRHLDDILRLLNKKHDEVVRVSPAFQWAQSLDTIFLNIKFASRWSSPGALTVDNSTIEAGGQGLRFRGVGKHSGVAKEYLLDLELFDEIDGDHTELILASVGKATITAKKTKPGKWDRLTKDEKKLNNMQTWWEMAIRYEDELEDEHDDQKVKKDILGKMPGNLQELNPSTLHDIEEQDEQDNDNDDMEDDEKDNDDDDMQDDDKYDSEVKHQNDKTDELLSKSTPEQDL